MDLPTALGQHVRDLVDGLGHEDDNLAGALTALVVDLENAVSTYLGLRLSLVLDDWPVTLTAFSATAGGPPALTSLRLDLSAFDREFDSASRIVFYAGTPGTFVDLAADLAFLHGRPPVALDVELPPPTVAPGFTGLGEYATINRAVGVLLARGQSPEEARAFLRRAAGAAGLSLPAYAAQLLGEEPGS